MIDPSSSLGAFRHGRVASFPGGVIQRRPRGRAAGALSVRQAGIRCGTKSTGLLKDVGGDRERGSQSSLAE
jgi:hypothetical protein